MVDIYDAIEAFRRLAKLSDEALENVAHVMGIPTDGLTRHELERKVVEWPTGLRKTRGDNESGLKRTR